MHELESRIENGIWRPGEQLPTLQKMAQEFNVAISTLREVLRILEHRNIITIEQGRGTFVRTDLVGSETSSSTSVTQATLKDFFEARHFLEPNLAFLAAQRGFMEELKQIRETANHMSSLVHQHEDFADADMTFHLLIAQASHNEMLKHMYSVVESQFLRGRRFTNMIPGMIDKAVHYHLMIAKAISARDAVRAQSLMQAHVSDMMSYVLNHAEISSRLSDT